MHLAANTEGYGGKTAVWLIPFYNFPTLSFFPPKTDIYSWSYPLICPLASHDYSAKEQ